VAWQQKTAENKRSGVEKYWRYRQGVAAKGGLVPSGMAISGALCPALGTTFTATGPTSCEWIRGPHVGAGTWLRGKGSKLLNRLGKLCELEQTLTNN